MDTTGPMGPATLGNTPATPTADPATTPAAPVADITTVVASAAAVTPPVVQTPSADVTVYSPVLDSVAILSPSNVIVPIETPPVQLTPYVVVNYGQCGGNKVYCDQVDDCVDAVWQGASCNPGFACNRYDETWWQCQPVSRRLLRLR